ncbi:uncharacterized protein LOC142979824 [Anticarsia gemmatalis]|uniref:uncharacterized protein LOC142979824 n=1 Tax=Anticarsia gemmatalis TaxID=129554 RepID=UPI003F762882
MFHKLLICLYFLSTNCLQDIFYPDKIIVGNLRRRDVVPLNVLNYNKGYRRRFNANNQANLKYRRSRDIRESVADRRFELTELQIREEKNRENLDQLEEQLRWLTIDADAVLGDQPAPMAYYDQNN